MDVGNATYMSFMIDSDTDVSTKECVIVHSRILRKGRPVNILIVQYFKHEKMFYFA